jgi:hypothetical protein
LESFEKKGIGLSAVKILGGYGVLIFREDIFEMKGLLLIFLKGGNC